MLAHNTSMRIMEFRADISDADLVREQDFILRLRRWQRHQTPLTMVNVLLTKHPALFDDKEKIAAVCAFLENYAGQHHAEMHALTMGDVFLVFPPHQFSKQKFLAELSEALTQTLTSTTPDDVNNIIVTYNFPADYTPLRESLNQSIDAVRAHRDLQPSQATPQQLLQSDLAQGSLTAWSLSQIEGLLSDLDVKRYIRAQPLYRHTAQGWQPIAKEYYIGIEELKKERFPRLNVRAPERLFLELCSTLDKRLLNEIAPQPALWENQRVHLNLAMETALTAGFAQFCKTVARDKRQNIVFELNRSDLLFDFSTTLNVIDILRREGFGIVLDGIHPEILPYFNIGLLPVDGYKIKVSRDHFEPLAHDDVVRALHHLPHDKIIFYRCEQEAALSIGQKLGIATYQGWLIDDLALGLGLNATGHP
ncbi:MAG: EAL domain-containing protein [Alphaproteobacteria bacterium]|nr:EAL domain-containing protein [Alphaproteobacteria bacterium]NDC56263.1 EAL domain-containing protein [Alphaproteobacteria bacterium]NDG04486.1 EAL domain-containing protein [Alphaproteobacteria bacterium]